jgi:SGNH domain (fused to AT3 domains)
MQDRARVLRLLVLSATTILALLLAGEISASGTLLATRTREASLKYPWKGSQAPCRVRVPISNIAVYSKYNTCPPKRVLVIGDSLAVTMAQQMAMGDENFGTLIKIGALLGCGFVTGYEIDSTGRQFSDENAHCNTEVASWVAQERTFKPQAVLVEMGWWDSQQHLINGDVESLADPSYDAMVMQSVLNLIKDLRTASSAPIFFLSVPWMDPPAWPNGQPNPAVTPGSHNEINALIKEATETSSTLHFVDISPYITPSGQYQQDVDGQVCRTADGVHLYANVPGTLYQYKKTKCGEALQEGVLSLVRSTLANK